MSSRYKQQLVDWLKTKDLEAEKVLSIGCQDDDRRYFATHKVDVYHTLDYNPDHKPDIVFDMNELPPSLIPNNYDAVLAFELWEYIYDPMVAHRNIAHVLKPGGLYYGSYPFVYGLHPPNGTDYLRYTLDAVDKLCRKVGLDVVELNTRHGNDLLPQFYNKDGMRVRKDVDHTITGCMVIAKKK